VPYGVGAYESNQKEITHKTYTPLRIPHGMRQLASDAAWSSKPIVLAKVA